MDTGVLMKQIRPFWGRATVVESPLDETERDSGLVLPHAFDGDDGVKRGVVQFVDDYWENEPGYNLVVQQIRPGVVVFYQGGVKIRDVVILTMAEILGYEVDE